MRYKCKFCYEDSMKIMLGFDSLLICKECVEYLSYLHNEEMFELSPEVAAVIFNAYWALLRNSDEKPNLLKLSDCYTIY